MNFNEKPNYLHVNCSGEVEGIEDMMKYSGIPLQKAFNNGYKKVFIDESTMKFKLTDFDQHALMNFFLNDFPKSIDVKFTVFFNKENKELVTFFENLSKKVGFDCTFYPTQKEALEKLGI